MADVRAAVALVVYPGGSLYAAMRSRERGLLSLLGGHVEPGEDPARAAAREAEEESGGVDVQRVRLLGAWPSDDGLLTAGYLAVRWAGDLRGSEEGPAEWAPREALLDPRRGAFPRWTRRLFAAYDAWLRMPASTSAAP